MSEQLIGKITHYFGKSGVAALDLKEPLSIGTRIHIHGHTTDFEQTVESMEINHQKIDSAAPGDNIAIKVKAKVRPGDRVYLGHEEEGILGPQGG